MAKLLGIGIASAAKIQYIINLIIFGIIGLVVGGVLLVLGLITGSAELIVYGITYLVMYPIFIPIFSLIFTVIGLAIFNWVAPKFGGIELKLLLKK